MHRKWTLGEISNRAVSILAALCLHIACPEVWCAHNSCMTFKHSPSIGTSDHIWHSGPTTLLFFPWNFALMTFWHFLPPSLTCFSLSFLPSLLPHSRLSLPPRSHYWLAFPCLFFFLYLLCHLTISSGFIVAINVDLSLPDLYFQLQHSLSPRLWNPICLKLLLKIATFWYLKCNSSKLVSPTFSPKHRHKFSVFLSPKHFPPLNFLCELWIT